MSHVKKQMKQYIELNKDNPDKIEGLVDLIGCQLRKVKECDSVLYKSIKHEIFNYTLVISEDMIDHAVTLLERKDGLRGVKWSKEDAANVYEQYKVGKDKPIDSLIWYFGLNYTYATHYGPSRNINNYIELALDEICDKTFPITNKILFLCEHL